MSTNSHMTRGIAVAGSILVDKLNRISAYPSLGELTKIHSVKLSVGGLVPNVGIDLKTLSPDLPVLAVGKVGMDDEAQFLMQRLSEKGIDIRGLHQSPQKTSFTEVMSVPGGQRTFFTYPGACADFGADDVDLAYMVENNITMLHLGYFLLLDKMDGGEGALLLQKASEMGIETSIDLVSENSDRYAAVLPCLPFTDNLIINETEAGRLTGMEPTLPGLRQIAEKLMHLGVRRRVILHMPELSVCLTPSEFTVFPSYELPEGHIKGTTGAGDAFCAGCLLGIYLGKSNSEILSLASAAAVMALSEADAVSGMKTAREAVDFCRGLARKKCEVRI